MAALVKLKEQGKIRAIGVSNANLAQLQAYGPIDSDQEKYSMLDRGLEQNGMLDYCRRQNISVFAYSPLANGLLTGKIRPDRQYAAGDLRRGNPRFSPANVEQVDAMLDQLKPIVQRHQATIGQLVIAWTAARLGMTCVLCGAATRSRRSRTPPPARLRFRPRRWRRWGELSMLEWRIEKTCRRPVR